jgi:hypothetical protein
MRVTLEFPDEAHRAWKARAAREGTTLRALVLRAIEYVLGEETQGDISPASPRDS